MDHLLNKQQIQENHDIYKQKYLLFINKSYSSIKNIKLNIK
jgi:hypothetical protein